MAFSIFKKLVSAPLTKVGRISLYVNNNGVFYSKDGNGAEREFAPSGSWPIGSIFMAAVSTDPSVLLGFGTWVRFGQGRMPISQDSANTRFDTAEETGGSETVTLTEATIPSHTHIQNSHNHIQDAHNHIQDAHAHTQDASTTLRNNGVGWVEASAGTARGMIGTTALQTATNQATTATNQNTGGGQAHENMPPYIVVYMWKRTA